MAAKHKSSFSLYDDEDEEDVTKKDQEEPPVKKNKANESGDKKEEKVDKVEAVEEQPPQVQTVYRSFFSVIGARKGERPEMEDCHVSLSSLLPPSIVKRSALFGIFDGHGGIRASRFCEANLPKTLVSLASQHKTLETLEKGMKKLMVELYKSVDDGFLKEARTMKPAWKDGTTATTLLVLNDVVYAANIGDSKAIVCRRKTEQKNDIIELTVDHNPQKFEERQRIEKAGGVVKNGRVDGIIEVSRSIGDGQFKTRGVTCMPDIKKFTLTQDDRFILIACDGLWKSFSNEEAVQFTLETYDKSAKIEEVMVEGEKARWQYVASELAAEAVRRKCGDNVSLLILILS